MSELETKLLELHNLISLAFSKKQEYMSAVQLARVKADELSDLCQTVINQPHIEIFDFEIDN